MSTCKFSSLESREKQNKLGPKNMEKIIIKEVINEIEKDKL